MIGLIDSTLREGEQMMGVYFTRQQKLNIIRGLVAIGIEEIEVGIAAMSPDMAEVLALARQVAPSTRLALWCRGCLPDIRASAALKPDVLSISLPVSDLHITKRLKKDRAWILRQITAVAVEARVCGIPCLSLGLEDATRADTAFLAAVLHQARREGIDRIRLADTLGVATPATIARLVKAVRKFVSLQLGVHTHNDFGMATANAIAALDAGADWADVTLLGIGERAGNARLEEVVGYLALSHRRAQYDTRRLSAACRMVARMSGFIIPPHHPIVGKGIFACETGLHLDGLAKDVATYEPFPPEQVQGIRKHMLGKKAGCNAVYTQLTAMGCAISREDAMALTPQIRTTAQRLGRPLTHGELHRLVEQVRQPQSPA